MARAALLALALAACGEPTETRVPLDGGAAYRAAKLDTLYATIPEITAAMQRTRDALADYADALAAHGSVRVRWDLARAVD